VRALLCAAWGANHRRCSALRSPPSPNTPTHPPPADRPHLAAADSWVCQCALVTTAGSHSCDPRPCTSNRRPGYSRPTADWTCRDRVLTQGECGGLGWQRLLGAQGWPAMADMRQHCQARHGSLPDVGPPGPSLAHQQAQASSRLRPAPQSPGSHLEQGLLLSWQGRLEGPRLPGARQARHVSFRRRAHVGGRHLQHGQQAGVCVMGRCRRGGAGGRGGRPARAPPPR